LDLSLLLPFIGLISTVVSKLLLLYSTIDKTSRLKMKFLHRELKVYAVSSQEGERNVKQISEDILETISTSVSFLYFHSTDFHRVTATASLNNF